MPDYLDEKIIAARREREKQKHKTLADGIYINNDLIEFIRVPLIEDRISVVMPESFIDMPKDMADIKYPYINRPQIIKTSLDTRVNYCFSYFPNELLAPDQPMQLADSIRALQKRSNPSLQFMELGQLENTRFSTGWYDFKSFAMDGQLYNIVFLCSVYDKLLHGLFNCQFEDVDEWKPAALRMIAAIGKYNEVSI
jgi:hypothetical protein